MNIDRDMMRRHELLTRRDLLKSRIEELEALRSARQFVDERNFSALETELKKVEAELKSLSA
jgi:hypothetical protein